MKLLGLIEFLPPRDDKTGRTVMKTRTTIKSLARIRSSVNLVGAGERFAPGDVAGGLATALSEQLSSRLSQENLRALGKELLAIARHARQVRQTHLVEWASQAIRELPPTSEFQGIGR